MIDRKYYAVQGKGRGIVDQTVTAGTKYDQTNQGDEILKLKVLDCVLDYAGKTESQFQNELNKNGFGNIRCKDENGEDVAGPVDRNIVDVKVYDKDDIYFKDPLPYFEKIINENVGDIHVCFMIIVKNLPQPPTSNTSGSVSDDDGSYSAPSVGYDNSGSYGQSYGNNNLSDSNDDENGRKW